MMKKTNNLTMNRIDTMIEIISEDFPEFLDQSKPEDRDIFTYVSYMIIMSKMICVDKVMSHKGIESFTQAFFDQMENMIASSNNISKVNMSYDYVTEIYTNLLEYLERCEEYEMCSNFRNFFIEFNLKTNELNDELEDGTN